MRKFTFAFKDEEDHEITPTEIKWSLTDTNGTVINSREDENVIPAASVKITINGDDTDLQAGEKYRGERIFILKIKFNSDAGVNMEGYAEIHFIIDNIENV